MRTCSKQRDQPTGSQPLVAIGDLLPGVRGADEDRVAHAAIAAAINMGLQHQAQDLAAAAFLFHFDVMQPMSRRALGIEPMLQLGKGASGAVFKLGGDVQRHGGECKPPCQRSYLSVLY
jgi:hypothetical protein